MAWAPGFSALSFAARSAELTVNQSSGTAQLARGAARRLERARSSNEGIWARFMALPPAYIWPWWTPDSLRLDSGPGTILHRGFTVYQTNHFQFSTWAIQYPVSHSESTSPDWPPGEGAIPNSRHMDLKSLIFLGKFGP